MNHQSKTNLVHNQYATHFDETFSNDGARSMDISRAFELAGNPTHARVVEIGCGTGRDAHEIVRRSAWFEGFDPANGLVEIARRNVPNGRFIVADATTYDYPQNIDVVFAFASLLHVSGSEYAKRIS